MKKKLLLVDGMALLFRGFFATSFRGNFMLTKDNVPTNGVHQFLRYFLHAVETFEPTHVVCCWDMGSKTFRTEMYDQYKANRPAPPEELVPQFDIVKEVVASFDIPNVGLVDYEADDCIGTIANAYNDAYEVVVLSGDHDLLQLVDTNINIAIMKKGLGNYDVYTEDNFFDKVGIHPDQMIDFKGLTGDAADNYPGVKGIGEKTALKLMTQYGSVDAMIKDIDNISPPGVQKRMKEHMDMLLLSRSLAAINCNVPVSCEIDEARWELDMDKIMDIATVYELERLIERELQLNT